MAAHFQKLPWPNERAKSMAMMVTRPVRCTVAQDCSLQRDHAGNHATIAAIRGLEIMEVKRFD